MPSFAILRRTKRSQHLLWLSIATSKIKVAGEEARLTNVVICQQAENLANWAKALIGITGRIQTRDYENQQGQRSLCHETVISSLLENRSNREGQSSSGYGGNS